MKWFGQKSLISAAMVLAALAISPAPAVAGLFGPPKLPSADTVVAPEPIAGNTGKYMCPFTSDGVTAEWVTKAMKVQAGGQLGALAGQYAGQQLMSNVPFVGGFLGQKMGNSAGRAIALKGIGGEEFLKSSSDLSFNSPADLLIYIYAKYSTRKDYDKILEATYSIYPELRDQYYPAIGHARLKPAAPVVIPAPAAAASAQPPAPAATATVPASAVAAPAAK